MIGIGITVHNRHETAAYTISKIRDMAPDGAKIVVIDDASDIPFPKATFRFKENVGIARAKNKCLELLDDCEHIFLFDDDCYPIDPTWHERYINAGVKHLMFTFDRLVNNNPNGRVKLREDKNFTYWREGCGCMLYYHKDCLKAVGGFDPNYIKWGLEHGDYSLRIFNAGVTPHPFMDIKDSLSLFYSFDYHCTIAGSVPDKRVYLNINSARFAKQKNSSKFYDYKEKQKMKVANVVIAAYFTSRKDPQRGIFWDKSHEPLMPLIESCQKHKTHVVILHDGLENLPEMKGVTWELCEPNPKISLIEGRRLESARVLKDIECKKVFLVDATDVEMQLPPWKYIKDGKIYVGSEIDMKVGCNWMKSTQEPFFRVPDYRAIMYPNAEHMLLNAGLIGGTKEIIMEFLAHFERYCLGYSRVSHRSNDMGVFNYVMFKHFKDRFEFGEHINTRFKYDERNETSWFKHK